MFTLSVLRSFLFPISFDSSALSCSSLSTFLSSFIQFLLYSLLLISSSALSFSSLSTFLSSFIQFLLYSLLLISSSPSVSVLYFLCFFSLRLSLSASSCPCPCSPILLSRAHPPLKPATQYPCYLVLHEPLSEHGWVRRTEVTHS